MNIWYHQQCPNQLFKMNVYNFFSLAFVFFSFLFLSVFFLKFIYKIRDKTFHWLLKISWFIHLKSFFCTSFQTIHFQYINKYHLYFLLFSYYDFLFLVQFFFCICLNRRRRRPATGCRSKTCRYLNWIKFKILKKKNQMFLSIKCLLWVKKILVSAQEFYLHNFDCNELNFVIWNSKHRVNSWYYIPLIFCFAVYCSILYSESGRNASGSA